jgi:hypothetical protein
MTSTLTTWHRWKRDHARSTARSQIGGVVDEAALARMHFATLDQVEQAAAIRRLAAAGHGANTLAGATGLSVEAVNQVLAGAVPTPARSA